ncbi:MAG: hypothetical protein IJT73_10020 [Selenomonadaceae bacterium]|nr:hypothetical protein [Selenomonadaceae bacterium]
METLKHFGYGFLDNWTAPKSRLDNKKISPSRRLIIPISEHHYLASTIDRNKVDKQWWKMHAGSKEIFNAANVTANSSTVKRTRNALFDTPNGGNVISSVKAAETNPNNKS